MAENNPKPENPQPDWKDAIGIFTLKLMDSGLAPWTLVALFLFGLTWLVTRNLDSKDSLALITKLGSAHGFAWLGWAGCLRLLKFRLRAGQSSEPEL
jgi:hypothetical protein